MAVKQSGEQPVPRLRGAKGMAHSRKKENSVQQNPRVSGGPDGEMTKEVVGGSVVKTYCDKYGI